MAGDRPVVEADQNCIPLPAVNMVHICPEAYWLVSLYDLMSLALAGNWRVKLVVS